MNLSKNLVQNIGGLSMEAKERHWSLPMKALRSQTLRSKGAQVWILSLKRAFVADYG